MIMLAATLLPRKCYKFVANPLNMPKLSIYCLSLWVLLTSIPVWAQEKDRVKLDRAEYLENGERNGEKFDKVIGNVAFSQKETKIYGDSAFFYKKRIS